MYFDQVSNQGIFKSEDFGYCRYVKVGKEWYLILQEIDLFIENIYQIQQEDPDFKTPQCLSGGWIAYLNIILSRLSDII